MPQDEKRKKKFAKIIIGYPLALILIAVVLNYLVFGVQSADIALPTKVVFAALAWSAVLLLVNHIWLMTSTELTRLEHGMFATPEEWAQSDHSKGDVSNKGVQELERRHNAHRNATENVVYFVFLAALVSVISPVTMAALVWMIGFAIGRLGHTFSYLSGRDGARGLFMSLSLISLYGLASYLMISLIV